LFSFPGDGGNNGNEIEERSKCDDPIFLKQVFSSK